jgi:hypothetical protein
VSTHESRDGVDLTNLDAPEFEGAQELSPTSPTTWVPSTTASCACWKTGRSPVRASVPELPYAPTFTGVDTSSSPSVG